MLTKRFVALATSLVVILLIIFVFKSFLQPVTQLSWTPEDKKMYKIIYKQTTKTWLGKFGFNSRNKVHVEGILNFKILEVNQDTIDIALQFSPVKVYLNKKQDPYIQKIYSTYFLARVAKTGEFQNFYFNNRLSRDEEILLIELVKPFQIVIPKNNDTRWEIEEKNSTGKYLAAYQASENIIVKQKLSLSDIQVKSLGQNLGQEALDANIEYSNIQFVLDSSSWTREVLGQERYAIQSELFHVTTSNAFKLKQIPLKADQNLTIWRDTKGFEDTIAEFKQGEKKKISYWQERKHIQLRQKYKKKKLVDFLKLFHKKTVGWQDMMSLKEYLDLYPQEALKIPDLLLRDSSIGSREQSKIIHVLELSGTAPAQDALVQIMTDSQQEAINRSRAIFALSGVRNPTEHAVDNLWQTYKKQTENTSVEQSNMAILALGHISFTQKDKAYLPDQNLSQQLKTRLSTELSNAEDHSNDKAIVLEAMGNARDESLFTEIKPYMTAEGAQVRIAAAHALRHMEDEDSMRLMTEQFVSEEVPQVRDAILQTLLEREPTKNAIATIGKGVLKEKNVRVRQSMIKYLIKNRKKNVSYKQTFAELLKTETSQANRKLLYKGLYSKKDKIIP